MKNKIEINRKLSELDKEVDNLKYAVTKDEKNYREQSEKLGKKLELLKEYVANDFKLTRLYTQAMSFLNWFTFEHIYSSILRKEASNKKYKELSLNEKFHNYSEHALNFVEEKITGSSFCYSNYNIEHIDTENWLKPHVNYFDPSVRNIYINGTKIEIEREEDVEAKKFKYEETVAYVVAYPFKFDEDVVISVYYYLKAILYKDEEVEKYENGGND